MPEIVDERAKQLLRLRRSLLGLGGAAVFALLLAAAYVFGFFRGPLTDFLVIISVLVVGALIAPVLIITDLNRKFPDPSLTILQITLATLICFGSIYFLDQLRAVFLMIYLTVMTFAAFRLKLAGFFFITAMALFCYGVVILLLLQFHPEVIELKAEIIRWVGFALTLGGFSLSGSELSELRRKVSRQNKKLNAALSTIKQQAITDELTGAFNRRHILDILRYQKSLADRGRYSFVVYYIDLDHFKRVNDHFGHNVGDMMLWRFLEEHAPNLAQSEAARQEAVGHMPRLLDQQASLYLERQAAHVRPFPGVCRTLRGLKRVGVLAALVETCLPPEIRAGLHRGGQRRGRQPPPASPWPPLWGPPAT